jgi:hypothetical protein
LIAIELTACAGPVEIGQRPMRKVSSADFTVADREVRSPLAFVIYGDMRFTSTAETVASQPGPRHAILDKVAAEQPDGLFLTGDVPWHGGARDDYRVFREETALWGEQRMRVYPVLGNHEFQQCTEAECLENWWSTFPQLRGRRWYSVDLGTSLRALALDSNASLLPDSAQRAWLERQVEAVPRSVRFYRDRPHYEHRSYADWDYAQDRGRRTLRQDSKYHPESAKGAEDNRTDR